ncbi:MAG: cobalamin-dependent protein [Marinilabiliales bacterium]|nr:cobalamin-dependent protein [Marinilabiliales bacterium]
MQETTPYKPKNHIRVVTAASLFDGHDAAINIMRRILQATGAEVIHLGHNRSVKEIVDCAIQEDAQAIAITSYQGGHMEFFKYMLRHAAGKELRPYQDFRRRRRRDPSARDGRAARIRHHPDLFS